MNVRATIVFISLALVYLATLPLTPYMAQFLPKALPIGVLAVFAYIKLSAMPRYMVLMALLFSLAGDISLALPFADSFITGLACFFVAHLTYAMCFALLHRSLLETPSDHIISRKPKWFISIIMVSFAVMMAVHILPASKALFYPVVAYIGVITLMGLTAVWLAQTKLIVTGALLFVISDAILAQSVFKTPLPLSTFWVMTTYYAAQYYLTKGLVDAFLRKEHRQEEKGQA
ncbi:lysoplasmalogenase [Alteromonas macleodii]|uniref:lysoplasmalogenase n=1 Tax=Alteromonas macleodii TaxID=28108 RepID=UPI002FE2EC3B